MNIFPQRSSRTNGAAGGFRRLASLVLLCCFAAGIGLAQRSRLNGPIARTGGRRVELRGHVRPELRNATDLGPLDAGRQLTSMMLVLRPSPEQEAALTQLLSEQQDPASPNYHRWLTPEEYADRFGASREDIAQIADWLRSQNLDVTTVARGRNSISFQGEASAVDRAFGVSLRNYRLRGQAHFANPTDPVLPVELEGMVAAIEGLNDLTLLPRGVANRRRLDSDAASQADLHPNYTSGTGRHYLSPTDFATIYNVHPLYAQGTDGSGESIVVVGQSQVNLDDMRRFRSRFGLPPSEVTAVLVPNSRDPGFRSGDQDEAHLDLQWAGAIARNAHIYYVYSTGVVTSVSYAIDQNMAPVISMSYGLCEGFSSAAQLRAYQTIARQANTQGITWINAAGDSGGSDCSTGTSSDPGGLSVDAPASVPEVTGIGGTQFDEGGGTYWGPTNNTDGDSALSYIPEIVWNESITNDPASGGGGRSSFFIKPSWQAGAGVPDDGVRDVPDVSLTSASHDGYLVYVDGDLLVFSGTSAATPAFAGIVALLNHHLIRSGLQATPGLGNINPRIYPLAQSSPQAFHDIVRGDNMVAITCQGRSPNACSSGNFGYSAAAGYDLATGLGSVDAHQFILAMTNPTTTSRKSAALSLVASAGSISVGASVTVTATLTVPSGTPTGAISFSTASAFLGSQPLTKSGNSWTAGWTVSGSNLALGSNTIRASYSGDGAFLPATATVNVTATSPVSSPTPQISGLTNAASFRTSYAPGMLLSIFGANLAPVTWAAPSVPLPTLQNGVFVTINGVPAPLLFISPTQLNVQVPYESAPGFLAALVVNNNGRSTTGTFSVLPAAPGIFINSASAPVPSVSGSPGQVLTLFITGAGFVSPQPNSGDAPDPRSSLSNLPATVLPISITVGGASAPIHFAGIPPGLVGVLQVNYQVPDVAAGNQPVIVTVGTESSAAATLLVTH